MVALSALAAVSAYQASSRAALPSSPWLCRQLPHRHSAQQCCLVPVAQQEPKGTQEPYGSTSRELLSGEPGSWQITAVGNSFAFAPL